MQNRIPLADGRVSASRLQELDESQGVAGAVLTATGSFSFTDADLTDTHWTFFSFNAAASGTTKPVGTFKTVMTADAKGGAVGQIGWTYSVPDAAIRYLAAGQTLVQTYNVMVDDRHGGTLVKPVTLTIVGTNEAPSLVAASGTVISAAVPTPTSGQTSVGAAGAFAFADPDFIDTHAVTISFDPAVSSATKPIGTLTAAVSKDATGGLTGQIGWSFSVAAVDLDQIDAGQTVTQAYDLTISDGQGGTAVQIVTVTLTGTGRHEPPPTMTIGLGNDTGESATDLVTRDARLVGTGAANAIVHFTIDGAALTTTATADETGAWSFTPTGLADGRHTIVASESNGSGTGSASLTVATDTAAPGTTIALAQDTGASSTDGSTSTPALTGSGDPNATVRLTIDGQSAGTALADAAGLWSYTPTGLADGGHVVVATETDVAGNTGTASLSFTLDTIAPAVSIALVADTGASSTDGITSNPAVAGSGDAGATVQFAVDGVALTGTVLAGSNGAWSYRPSGLAPGSHTVVATETDAAGNTGSAAVSFTLEGASQPPPASPIFALAAADQSGVNQTRASTVTLVGHTSPGDAVILSNGAKTVASNDGTFQFSNVALGLGANDLTATTTDSTGLSSSYELVIDREAAAATPSMAVIWNRQTLSAIQTAAADPEMSSRLLAIESLAVYDVVSGINGTPGYLVNTTAPAGASADAAVAEAAYTVLSSLYPRQTATFAAKLATSLAGIPDGQAKTDGIAYGRTVANQLLALRAGDGWNDLVDDEGSTAVGQWRPAAPNFSPAENPQWATLDTFALSSPDQFRAPAPPNLTSQAYADAVNETLSLGAANSTTRTADQTQIAKFWNDGVGSYTPPGHWNDIADTVATQSGDSLAQDARLLAMLNVAEADSAIAAWDTKYTYNTWRPITVAADAASIGNPAITAIPDWAPLINTPSHPEYVSGHSTFSAAAASVLNSVFGTSVSFTIGSTSLGGVTRSFTSFDQAAAEAGESRIYGGIHFEFSNQAGQTIGTQVGQWVLDAFDLTKDTVPPKVVLDQKSGLVTNKALSLTGSVIDNLSGVANLAVTLDGAAINTVSLAANGTFAASLGLVIDGTADGQHTVQLIATDAAGNVAAPVSFGFTLDTIAPTIALASSSVQDKGTLGAGSILAGSVQTEAGVSLTALSYAIDGGTAVPLAFDTNNAWSQTLDLTHLAAGTHTLVLTARDAAGNTTTDTLQLSLPNLPPLTIADLTPMMGAGDVGVTYKPQITFSRAVDTSTLTSSSFYATDTTGAKLAATIVPTQDGTGAYLFFTNPLPGASTITLHVDGSLIKAKADGALLDAAGTGTPGSVETETFTTVSMAPVPNTSISGIVLDPGADLTPMTPDDFGSGPNGPSDFAHDTWKLPIAHVKVYIIGYEDQAVYTDAAGKFTLSSVPTGDVKVVFDGRTATNAPSGLYFPAMTMDTTIRPGIVNTIMGSMGTAEAQAYNATNPAVYLPRVNSSILTTLSATAPTVVTVPQESASGLTTQQASALTLTVAPGSLVDENGNPVTDAQVGISPVPPQIVMDMLPPGVMQHTFDITIQAPAGAAFTTPAVLTLPNVFNAAPGTKLDILSFDHDTGRLMIDGTGTVSADGLTVTTDPGSGVTKPGWHGLAPPGTQASGDPGVPCLVTGVSSGLDALQNAQAGLIAGGKFLGGIKKTIGSLSDVLNGLGGKYQPQISQAIYDETSFGQAAAKAAPVLKSLQKFSSKGILGKIFNVYGTIKDAHTLYNDLSNVQKTKWDIVKDVAKLALDGAGFVPALKLPVAGINLAIGAYNLIDGKDFDKARDQLEAAEKNYQTAKAALSGTGQWAPNPNIPVDASFELAKNALDDCENSINANQALAQSLSANLPFLQEFLDNYDPAKDYGGFTPDDFNANIDNLANIDQQLQTAQSVGDPSQLAERAQNLVDTFSQNVNTVLYTVPQMTMNSGGSPSRVVMSIGKTLYAAIESDDGTIIRLKFDSASPLSVFLAPYTRYTITVFDPQTLSIGQVSFTSGPSGTPTTIPLIPLTPQSDFPRDGGLDALAAFVLGVDPSRTSNLVAGVGDLVALQSGLVSNTPLASLTGVSATVALGGNATSVILAASATNLAQEIAFVATGSSGLALVDVSTSVKPTILGQLKLTGGTATDVAVDTTLSLAAVATGTGGLQIVNVADPTKPALVQSIAINATQVEILDGIAYANDGATLDAIDLSTGEILQTLALGGGTLTGMALDGTTLYTMDANRTMRAIDISGVLMVAKGSVTLALGGQKISVGGGVAYVGAADGFNGGYATVDISDPANLKLIEGRDATNIAGTAIALNGSGLGVLVGNPGGVFGTNVIDVVNTSDPAKTGQFVTRYTLPSTPYDVAIGEGIAFVADGTSGLQVVNYKAFDTQGVAPIVAITTAPTDIDPNTAGIQVVEGGRVSLAAAISDDVQIRNVEVLVNGKATSDDVSYPWQLSTIMPTIAANGSNTVTLQVEAVDTGGNTTTTTPITLQLVRDTVAPTIVSQGITQGAVVGQSFRSITLSFSKPLDTATVTTRNFFLKAADGSVLAATALQSRSDGRVVELTYPVLAVGSYMLELNATAITDRAGNALGAGPIDTGFTVQPFSEEWKGGTGSWQTASKWSKGLVPGATDDVLLNLPSGVTVTFSGAYNSVTKIARLAQTNAGTLALTSGTLDITGSTNLAGTLQLNGGTLQADGAASVATLSIGQSSSTALTGAGDITVTNAFSWIYGTVSGSGKLIVGAGATATLGTATIGFYGNLGRELDIAGAATMATGTIYLYYYNSAAAAYVGSTLAIQAGGSLALTAADQIYTTAGGALTNAGTLAKSGAGTTSTINAAVTNAGTIDVESGTLDFTAAVSNTGTIDIKDGGTLSVSSGSLTLGAGSQLKDSGTLLLSGGTLTITDATTVPVLTVTSGTLSGAGDLTLGTALAWSGGSILGTGKVTVAKTATLLLGAPTGYGYEQLGRELDLAGSATLGRNSTLYLGAYDSGASAYVNGMLAVQAGATLTLETGSNVYNNGTNSGTLTNAGTITKTASGNSSINTAITNTGTIIVNGGGFSLAGPATTNSGTIDVESGTLTSSGTFTNSGTLAIKSGATLDVSGTFTLAPGSQVQDSGTLMLSNGTLAVATATAIPVLTVTNGTVTGTGDITIATALAWSGGSIVGAGKITVASTATLTLGVPTGGGSAQLGRELDLAGTGTLSRNGTLYLGAYDSSQNTYVSGKLAVQAGASLTLETGTNIANNGTNTGALTNAGTITKTGNGTASINVSVSNAGTVDIESGTLTSSGTFANSGTLAIKSGAILNVSSGTFTLATGSRVQDAGALLLSGGTLSVADATIIPVLTVTAGTVSGTGDLIVGTALTWSGGSMLGNGKITVATTATLLLGSATGYGSEQLGRELDLAGTGTLGRNSTLYLGAYDSSKNAYVSGTLAVQAGASLTLDTGSNIYNNSTNTGALTNAGTIIKTGTGTATVNTTVANTGTITVAGGTLSLSGNMASNAGTVDVESGTLTSLGTFTNSGTLAIKSGGTLNVSSGTFTLATGSQVQDAGTLLLSGGTLAIADAMTIPVLTMTGGTMSGTGDLTVGTALAWSGGSLLGSGTVTVGSAATLTLGLPTGGGSEQLGRTLGLEGKGTLSRNNTLYLGTYDSSKNAYVNGTLAVRTGASLTLESGSDIYNYGTNTGALTNAGTITKTGTVTTNINVSVTNTGTMNVAGGVLDLSGTVTGTGSVIIGADATLQIDGSFASGQTVQFAAATGALKLTNATNFHARIAGLTGHDYIDLASINPASASISFAEDASNTFGTLLISYGAQTVSLTLSGQYTSSDFESGADGAGGLAIALASAGLPIVPTNPGLSSGTLTTDLVISSSYDWSGGAMVGPGETTVATGGKLAISNTVNLGRELDVAGSAAMTDGAIYLGAYDSSQNAYVSGTLAIQAGGSLTADNNGVIQNYGTNTGVLTNAGTIAKTGPGTTTISTAVTNTGTIDIESGTLTSSGKVSSSGALLIKSGGTLNLASDTFTLAPGSQVQDAGTLLLSGGTLASTDATAIPVLTMTGGTIAGGDLTIGKALTWSGGAMIGAGKITVAQAATAQLGGGQLGRELDMAGSAAVTDNTLYLGAYDSGKNVYVSGTLAIQTGGSLTLDNNSGIQNYGTDTGVLTNAGTITKTGPGTASINTALTNTGTIDIESGTLTSSGTFSSSGAILIKSASTLNVTSGAFTLATGSQVQDAGTLLLSGGTLAVADATTIPVFTMTGGTLRGTGDLTIGAAMTWSGGSMFGTGKTVIAKTATAQLGNGQLGRELDVAGSAAITDSTLYLNAYDNGASAYVGGTLAIQAGGSLTIDNNSGIQNYGTTTGMLTNAGTITKTGPGTTTIGTAVNNSGTLTISSGTLSLNSGIATNTGKIDIESGTLTSSGTFSGSGAIIIQSGSTLNVTFGTFTLATGSQMQDAGTLQLSGGRLVIADATSIPVLTMTGGTLAGTGDLTIGKALDWSGGSMTGAGKTVIANTATAQLGNGQLGRELDVAGSATMTDSTLYLDTYDSSANAYVSGTLAVRSGGSLTLDNNSGIQNYGINSGILTNAGTITKTGPGTTTIGTALTNSGTIGINAGTLDLRSSAVNAGTFDVSAGAKLQVDVDLTGAGTINMHGAGSMVELAGNYASTVSFDDAANVTLRLDKSSVFTGLVQGFGANSTLDLADITGGFASLSYTQGQYGGVLNVTDGTRQAHIAFAGQHALSDFVKSSDLTGGTFIRLHA